MSNFLLSYNVKRLMDCSHYMEDHWVSDPVGKAFCAHCYSVKHPTEYRMTFKIYTPSSDDKCDNCGASPGQLSLFACRILDVASWDKKRAFRLCEEGAKRGLPGLWGNPATYCIAMADITRWFKRQEVNSPYKKSNQH